LDARGALPGAKGNLAELRLCLRPEPSPTGRDAAGLLSRKVTGEVITRGAPKEPESEMSSSTFRDFFSLGAGVTLPKEV